MTTWKHGFFTDSPLTITPNGSVAGWPAGKLAKALRRHARDGGFWRESNDSDNLNLSLRRAIKLADEGLGEWGMPSKVAMVYAFAAKSPHKTSAELRLVTAAHTELEAICAEMAGLEAAGWLIVAKSWK